MTVPSERRRWLEQFGERFRRATLHDKVMPRFDDLRPAGMAL
jgi:hypothetical protein